MNKSIAAAALIVLISMTACSGGAPSDPPPFVYPQATFPKSEESLPDEPDDITSRAPGAESAQADAGKESENSVFTEESGQAHEPPRSGESAPEDHDKPPAHTEQGGQSQSSPSEEQTAPPKRNDDPAQDGPDAPPYTEESEPLPPADEDDSVPPLPDKPADMVISYDPLHNINIDLDGLAVRIYGTYQGSKVISAEMAVTRTKDLRVSADGDSFDVSFTCVKPWLEYESVLLKFENGVTMDFRVRITDSGLEPLQSPVLQKNRDITKIITTLPREGVEQYIIGTGQAADSDIAGILAEIKSLSYEICRGVSGKYNKARVLAWWVSTNIYYDFDARDSSVDENTLSLAHVLETHRSVCGGFANLYSALCAAQGIRCLNISGAVVTGAASFSEGDEKAAYHEWTVLDMGGRYIWVDTVWNSSYKYQNGRYYEGLAHWQYFDISDELISNDHRAATCEYRDYFGLFGSDS